MAICDGTQGRRDDAPPSPRCAYWDGNAGSCLKGKGCFCVSDHVEGRFSRAHPLAVFQNDSRRAVAQPAQGRMGLYTCPTCNLALGDDSALRVRPWLNSGPCCTQPVDSSHHLTTGVLQDHYKSVEHKNQYNALRRLAKK